MKTRKMLRYLIIVIVFGIGGATAYVGYKCLSKKFDELRVKQDLKKKIYDSF